MDAAAVLLAAFFGYFTGKEIESWLVVIANRRMQRDIDKALRG